MASAMVSAHTTAHPKFRRHATCSTSLQRGHLEREKKCPTRGALYAQCVNLMNKDAVGTLIAPNKPSPETKGTTLTGQNSNLEDLWNRFFQDPSQWRDNRFNKRTANSPDFLHKETKEVLWVNSWSNPPWVHGKLAKVSAALTMSGQEQSPVALWKQLFSQPSDWWDHRFEKKNPNFPDFKHKKTEESLWIDRSSTPEWVLAELALLAANAVQQSPFTWHAIISRSLNNAELLKALDLLQQMHEEGIAPSKATFILVLKACSSATKFKEGQKVHAIIIAHGYESDVFVASCLVDMYSKCGRVDCASRVFNGMASRDVVAWSTMIQAYAKSGQGEKALVIYRQMEASGVKPDTITFISVLKACASLALLEEGRSIHRQIMKSGCEPNLILNNCLIHMYAKCGCIDDAEAVFNNLLAFDSVSWTTMIIGYVQCGKGRKALEIFHRMRQEGMAPDAVTFVGVLNACASIGALEEGRHIHAHVLRDCCKLEYIGNCLVDLYGKCGSIEDAFEVFSHMTSPDLISWNSMIGGYVKSGQGEKALDLFRQMKREAIEPDPTTFVGVVSACASISALEEGRRIHADILKRSCDIDVFIGSSLVHMYSKCGCVQEAWDAFSELPVRDVIAWSSMIMGFAKYGYPEKALDLFEMMQSERVAPDKGTFVGVLNACSTLEALEKGRSIHAKLMKCGYLADPALGSCLIDMYSKCGSIEEAREVFDALPTHDTVSWSTMIFGYAKCGQGEKALELFHRMQREKVQPDLVTYLGALNACSAIAALEQGRLIHLQVIESGWEKDATMSSCLVHMYARCGSIKAAQNVFDKMRESDVITRNALLGGYASHGFAKEVVNIFEKLYEDGEANEVTFVNLLSGCSHAGILDEGQYYFESMTPLYGVSRITEHYCCMVDLVGRSGALIEAENILNTMPLLPTVHVWMALLGACRTYQNLEIGERAAKRILELDPENTASYTLLSDTYEVAGESVVKDKVHDTRPEKEHIFKQPQRTSIKVGNGSHTFIAKEVHRLMREASP